MKREGEQEEEKEERRRQGEKEEGRLLLMTQLCLLFLFISFSLIGITQLPASANVPCFSLYTYQEKAPGL